MVAEMRVLLASCWLLYAVVAHAAVAPQAVPVQKCGGVDTVQVLGLSVDPWPPVPSTLNYVVEAAVKLQVALNKGALVAADVSYDGQAVFTNMTADVCSLSPSYPCPIAAGTLNITHAFTLPGLAFVLGKVATVKVRVLSDAGAELGCVTITVPFNAAGAGAPGAAKPAASAADATVHTSSLGATVNALAQAVSHAVATSSSSSSSGSATAMATVASSSVAAAAAASVAAPAAASAAQPPVNATANDVAIRLSRPVPLRGRRPSQAVAAATEEQEQQEEALEQVHHATAAEVQQHLAEGILQNAQAAQQLRAQQIQDVYSKMHLRQGRFFNLQGIKVIRG